MMELDLHRILALELIKPATIGFQWIDGTSKNAKKTGIS
jgi:hypothetical protein